jgi:hypothetical protein
MKPPSTQSAQGTPALETSGPPSSADENRPSVALNNEPRSGSDSRSPAWTTTSRSRRWRGFGSRTNDCSDSVTVTTQLRGDGTTDVPSRSRHEHLTGMNTQDVLSAIDVEIARLQSARFLLTSTASGKRRGRPRTSESAGAPKRRTISAAGRKKIAEARRKRRA